MAHLHLARVSIHPYLDQYRVSMMAVAIIQVLWRPISYNMAGEDLFGRLRYDIFVSQVFIE